MTTPSSPQQPNALGNASLALGILSLTLVFGIGLCALTGVAGVTQSGIEAAKAVLNCRTRDILTQNGPSLTFLPSDGKAVSVSGLRF